MTVHEPATSSKAGSGLPKGEHRTSLLDEQRRILELATGPATLAELLSEITLLVERHLDGALCSILIREGDCLRHGAAPSLPPEYNALVDGYRIGPCAASCGTAAFRRQPVVVVDVETDPLWEKEREIARAYGLRACWSTPVLSSSGEVLGTFANYHRTPYTPAPSDFEVVEIATGLARIVIERDRILASLQETGETLRAIIDASPLAIIATDVDGCVRGWNPAAERLYGFSAEDVLGRTLPTGVDDVLLELSPAALETPVATEPGAVHRRRDGTPVDVDVVRALLHDRAGRSTGVMAIHADVSERRRAEAALQRREAILAALARGAERLLATDDLDRTVPELLAALGEAADVDAVTFWLNARNTDATVTSNLHSEWRSSEDYPTRTHPDARSVVWGESYQRWADLLESGKPVVGNTRDFPPDERRSLERMGTRSVLAIPVFAAGEWIGLISFLQRHEREWSAAEADALHAVAGMVGAAFERARTTRELIESEERFRSAFDASNVAIAVTDLDGRLVRVNPAFVELVGRPAEDLLGRTPDEFTHPDDLPPKLALFAELLRGERSHFELENRYVRPDGTVVWGHATGSLARDASGRPVSYVGVITDITERKQAEEALRRSEASLARAQAIAHLGSWEWDIATDQLTWSDETFRICGFEPGAFEPTNARFHELIPPEDRKRLWELTGAAFETGTFVAEHRLVRPDGETRIVREEGHVDFDAQGKPIQMVGTILDLTSERRAEEERRLLEAKVQEAQKLETLGVLAGGIAHDFNNLLMGILGNAGLALADLPPGETRDHVAQIETAARRAAELTSHLLAYAGKTALSVVPLDLSALVSEMAEGLSVALPRNVAVTYELDRRLPAVEADPVQVRRIVTILVTNAAEAIGDAGGTIAVKTSVGEVGTAELASAHARPGLEPGRFVCLEVEDTGQGMDPETVHRIFEPFFTTKFAGRGLGLASLLGIVHAHGGAISVESAPGEGSVFRVLLPPSDESPARSAAAAESGPVEGTVLVVDDEPSVLAVVKAMLDRAGYRTMTASDGQEAFELFRARAEEIALVLLDMTMPVVDGVETLARIRSIRADVPVLLSSGHAEIEGRIEADDPSVAFIQKPYRQTELVELIERLRRQ